MGRGEGREEQGPWVMGARDQLANKRDASLVPAHTVHAEVECLGARSSRCDASAAACMCVLHACVCCMHVCAACMYLVLRALPRRQGLLSSLAQLQGCL